ncbi:hypothetical protein HII31_00885 [Pseudocercospora fuligena]|uniref:Uncharacterized protein n=1 Tax=Pseudocercospora fuligena TaxID=685502 RepID=A0A8H6RX38_9PEZI|nr:hypothetical protein HII31_00885 [Pseudocercospora fuligena]
MAVLLVERIALLCLCFLSVANARNLFPRQSFSNTSSAASTTSECIGLGCGFVPPVVNTSSAALTASATGINATSNSSHWTVAPTGSGLSYIFACNEEYVTWGVSQTSTWISQTWSATNFTASTSTYCEGNDATAHVIGTITPTATWIQTALTLSGYKGPEPTCSVGSSQCKSLEDELLYTFSIGENATAMAWGNSAIGTTTTTLASEPVTTLPTFVVNNKTLIPNQNGNTYNGYSLSYHWLLPDTNSTEIWMGPDSMGDPTWMPFCRKTASSTSTPTKTMNGTSTVCPTPTCTIYGGHVKMMFFPLTTTAPPNVCATWPAGNGSFCPYGGHGAGYNNQDCGSPNITRWSNTTDSGHYITLDGNTLYKNKAYISMETAYALDECNNRIGGNYQGRILTMASTSIYSLCDYSNGYPPQYNAYPVNFQDFEGPIPHSAWSCMPYCNMMPLFARVPQNTATYINGIDIQGMGYRAWCSPDLIFSEGFLPVLAVPPQIRDLDPAWKTCALDLRGLYDPPSMLTQVPTAAAPTLPTASDGPTSTADPPAPTTRAQAGPSITSPAQQTSTPSEDPKPTVPTAQPESETSKLPFTFDPTTSSDDPSETTEDAGQGSSDTVHPPIIQPSASSLDQPSSEDPAPTNSDPLGNAISIILTAANPPASTSAGGIASFIGQGLGISSANTPQASPTNALEAMTASSIAPANTQGSVTNVILPDTTLQPGDTATVSGNTIALPSNGGGIVVNGASSELQPATSGGAVTLQGGIEATAVVAQPTQPAVAVGSQTQLVLPGTTLQPGDTATVSGNTIVFPSGGNGVVVNGASSKLQPAVSGEVVTLQGGVEASAIIAQVTQPAVAVGRQTQLVLSGTTLQPGSTAVISGVTVSLESSGNGVFVNGVSATQAQSGPITLTGGIVATPTAATQLVVGSQTLVAGGSAITLSGTTYTASGSQVVAVAHGQSSTFDMPTSPHVTTAAPELVIGTQTLTAGGSALTVSGTTYTAHDSEVIAVADGWTSTFTIPTSAPAIVFGSQPLSPGGSAITVSGTTYSASGTEVIVKASGHSTTVDLGLVAATAEPSEYQSEALESITEAVGDDATTTSTRTSTRIAASTSTRLQTDASASATSTSGSSRNSTGCVLASVIAMLYAIVR